MTIALTFENFILHIIYIYIAYCMLRIHFRLRVTYAYHITHWICIACYELHRHYILHMSCSFHIKYCIYLSYYILHVTYCMHISYYVLHVHSILHVTCTFHIACCMYMYGTGVLICHYTLLDMYIYTILAEGYWLVPANLDPLLRLHLNLPPKT